MKLLDASKKLLKYIFQEDVPSQEIVLYNQIISIPSRDTFTDNQEMLNLIDSYKSEYKNMLSQFKYLTSLDINSKDLSEDMSTNIELLLNIFMTSDEVKKYTLNDKLRSLINIRKLDLYRATIGRLEAEVTARLIALDEIYSERKTYISTNKKNAVANEINNLSGALVLFQNKKLAIELEKSHYLTNAIYMVDSINNPLEEEHLISKKRNLLLNMVKVLFPDKMIDIREDKKYVLMDIAYVERMIEIYVYHHKDEVEDLRLQLEHFSEYNLKYKKKDEMLSTLKDLEYRYLAFYEYGRDYIEIEDLMQLYLIKFNVLVLNDDGICDPFVDENTTDVELDCYKGILEREIESFIRGEYELNNPEFIKTIIKILKSDSQYLDVERILKDKYLLNVFLSMGNKDDLINLLKKFKVNRNDYKDLDFCDEVFEFDDYLPLETIFRLMLSQNIGGDAKLYELLKEDIYPDGDYYYLPVGLKSINYNVEDVVEDYVLNNSTLLMINKMRELMNGKYCVCPTSLTRIKGGRDFLGLFSIKSLIFDNGLEIDQYDIDDIEVLEITDKRIVYRDNKTKEIICSNLDCNLDRKLGYYTLAGLTTHVPSKGLYVEEYHPYEYDESHLQQCLNVIEARRKNDTLFSRSYVDVSTKYGDFCLHIEEKNADNQNGPHVWLSLYHGKHDEIYDDLKEDFNWSEYGIFRSKYMKKNDFYQWMLGFVDNVWNHPFRNIWSYGQTKVGNNISYSPIHSFSEYQGNGKRGTIFIDGTLKLKDNLECIPDMFENLKVDEYESIPCNSKAYFGSPSEHVAIIKDLNSNNIRIIYKQKNRRFGSFQEVASTSVKSNTNKQFNEYDIEKIVSAIDEMPIDNYLKKFIIDELNTYISIHSRNESFYIGEFPGDAYINLGNVLKLDGYDVLLDILDRNDPCEFVEKLIESISQTFHISIDNLLGYPKHNDSKVSEEAKKQKRLFKQKDN